MSDLLDRAQIADIEARLEALESKSIQRIPHEYLATLYLDAAKNQEESEVVARAWVRQIMALDTKSLLYMAQQTYDPFPWQPLLFRITQLAKTYPEARVAETHLRKIAENLMALQGLYPILGLDDVGEYVPAHVRAFLAIRTRKEIERDEENASRSRLTE